MAIPKSAKLANESNSETADFFTKQLMPTDNPLATDVIRIRPVRCCNDFVAIVQTQLRSTIELTETHKFQNEGVVVGVGPGVASGNGTRCPSQLSVGDRVAFYGNPSLVMEPKDGPYAGQRVVVYPERSILCHLHPQPTFEIIE